MRRRSCVPFVSREEVAKERPVRGDRRGKETSHELGDGDERSGHVVPGRVGG